MSQYKAGYAITFAGTFIYSTLFMNPDMNLAHQIKFKHRGLSHSDSTEMSLSFYLDFAAFLLPISVTYSLI